MKQKHGGLRPGAGKKPFTPTEKDRAKVKRLSQDEGVPYDKIAPQVRDGISVPTLMKYFGDELVPAKRGTPPFIPTDDERRLVEVLVTKGLRYVDIAAVLRGGISTVTLWRHFLPELQRGRATAALKVAETLYEKATIDKDTTALIWWTKSQMGWKAAKDAPKEGTPDSVPVERIERVVVQQQTSP